MFERPDLMAEHGGNPSSIADDSTMSTDEKLARLRAMKEELDRDAGDATAEVDTVEDRMAAINAAMSRVQDEHTGKKPGAALGRMPSA